MPAHEASHLPSSVSASRDLDARRPGASIFMLRCPYLSQCSYGPTTGPVPWEACALGSDPSGQGHAFHAHPSCHDVRNASVVRLESALDLPQWFLPFASGFLHWGLLLFCFHLGCGHALNGKQVLCPSPVARRPSLKSLNTGLRHI